MLVLCVRIQLSELPTPMEIWLTLTGSKCEYMTCNQGWSSNVNQRTSHFAISVYRIEPKIFVLDDGNLFPFLHSTDIYPEWPVAALNHVPKDVAEEVQEALFALQTHAEAHDRVHAGQGWDPRRCDTTTGLAELASDAAQVGKLAGFRSSRSYFEVRPIPI